MINPFNAKVRAIARREYLQRVRTRWFLFATFGLPLIVVGLGAFSGFLIADSDDETSSLTMGIVDRTGRIGDYAVAELLRDSVIAARVPELAGLGEDELRRQLLDSSYGLYVVIPADAITAERPEIEAIARDNVPGGTRRAIRDAVNRSLVRVRLEEIGVTGVDPEALLREASLDVTNVSEAGARSQEMLQVISLGIALIFYMVLLFYGQMIVRSVLEEKTSDIVEVMVSSVRPWELMAGKIVGVGAVGLTQVAIWAIVAGAMMLYGLTVGQAMLGEAGIDLSAIDFPWVTAILILLFLVLGYLLYAGLFAGAGATVTNEHDAQQVLWPVMMLIVVPFIAATGVADNPNATSSLLLSLVPFFSPLLMPTRLLVTTIPLWQLAAALILLIGCAMLAAWAAGRVYRIGILMKGKRPNFPELIRWVRHG